MPFLFTTKQRIDEIKNKMLPENIKIKNELNDLAEELLKKNTESVTYYKSPAKSGDPHDYFSEGPYWWPDPQNPGGPFIRRDGEYYPNAMMSHRYAMENMSNAVLHLTLAGFFLNHEVFLDRAIEHIQVFFINEKTKMNPHMEYAQAIRGVCDGRGIGIIDARVLIKVVHACTFLELYPKYNETLDKLKIWFADFSDWLVNSQNGKDEKYHGNNHSTWYTAILASIALWIGKDDVAKDCFDFYSVLMKNQISLDGGLTDELSRTNSFKYSCFNLDAFAVICELALNMDIDLWNREADGRSIAKAVDFMIPYMENPFLWKWEQIDGEIPDENYAFKMAALRLGKTQCLAINEKRAKNKYVIRFQEPLGPLALI